jgi:F-type H+-transporting ATPase subunit epsilon
MEKVFKVSVCTPEKIIFDGDVVSLIAPGEIGSFGVLADHAPFISSLTPGKIILKDAHGKVTTIQSAATGFFEVLKNKAVFLLDAVVT